MRIKRSKAMHHQIKKEKLKVVKMRKKNQNKNNNNKKQKKRKRKEMIRPKSPVVKNKQTKQ